MWRFFLLLEWIFEDAQKFKPIFKYKKKKDSKPLMLSLLHSPLLFRFENLIEISYLNHLYSKLKELMKC